MTTENTPGSRAAPRRISPSSRALDAREGVRLTRKRGTDKEPSEEFELANSTIVVEPAPIGLLARIEKLGSVDYAGPLPSGTLAALVEVADEH